MSRVAFLGLGRMGTPMAVNLVKAGHKITVWNHTHTKALDFAAGHGATAAQTPGAAAEGAEFVITMLADDAALLDAYRGPDGVLGSLNFDAVAIDTSTVSRETIVALATEVAQTSAGFVDAPVIGSVAAATAASLTIMSGVRRTASATTPS